MFQRFLTPRTKVNTLLTIPFLLFYGVGSFYASQTNETATIAPLLVYGIPYTFVDSNNQSINSH